MNSFSFRILLGLFLCSEFVFGQETNLKKEFTFMFYNMENIFDCVNDSLTSDDEFTPEGDRRWNWVRFNTKVNRISKVILAAGKWNAPVIVGLCEVENRQVLERLTKSSFLNKLNYKIVHKDSPDERGIDVAFIYRPDFFRPFDYQAIPVIDPTDPSFKTRDILEVIGVFNGCDTICVFVNHWPSKYGGVMETLRLRSLAALTLKNSIKAITSKYLSAKIICMGDFNDNPREESLITVLEAREKDNPEIPGEMINLASDWMKNSVQTIKNKYSWESYDQWIVSDNLFAESGCFNFLKAEVFSPEFLLEPDPKFGGVKPKRTYVGFKYQEGFSDHLPILLRFEIGDH